MEAATPAQGTLLTMSIIRHQAEAAIAMVITNLPAGTLFLAELQHQATAH